jgi:tetratricopeptide (TPR) repeat protein
VTTPNRKQVYDRFMNMGHGFAWDKAWDKAVAAYARALQEVPEDPEPHKYLGLALLESKRYPDALKVYTRAHQLAPDDPVPLEKSADVLERLGRLREAAQQYTTVADIYLSEQNFDKAIGNFERATLLTPGLLPIHYRLAQLYERTGRTRPAVLQYLTLAFNFQRSKDKIKSLQAIERALRLEPSNPQVLNAKLAIERGELMAVPQAGGTDDSKGAKAKAEPAKSGFSFDEAEAGVESGTAVAHPQGPVGEATDKALADLAEELLEGGLSMAEAQAIQGIELQKAKEYQSAVESFLSAQKMGIRFLSMYVCMGALYLELKQYGEARKYFERVLANAQDYAAGAAHGLGLSHLGLAEPRKATEYLIRALQIVDTSLAMNQDEAGQLTSVYDQLRASTTGMMDGDLNTMSGQFNKWLTGTDWKVRIPETRRSLASRIHSGAGDELKYYVADTDIVDMVGRIDKFIKAKMLTLAMDEAFRAIEKEPASLPVHQRVAQILMEEGKIQEAINKYNIVANSFLARDDRGNAAAILDEVIKIAPMDTGLRLSLIELLEREGQQEKMLDEYVGLASAYYQLAEIDQARDTYQEALRLAQKTNAGPDVRAKIMYSLADIYMSRLDFRQAQRTYEQVRNLLPDEDKPRRELIDINYKLNNPLEAIKELDGMLRLFAQKKRGDLILGTLEQMVQAKPNDMALRSRLAAVYRQINRKTDAIAQLDALGELQLEAGMYKEACVTINQIIALQPPDTTQYRQLLSELGC